MKRAIVAAVMLALVACGGRDEPTVPTRCSTEVPGTAEAFYVAVHPIGSAGGPATWHFAMTCANGCDPASGWCVP